MWLALVTGIVVASVRRSRMPGIWSGCAVDGDQLFVVLYLAWMLVELGVSARDTSTVGKTTADAATCQLYGFGQALTLLSALWLPSAWHAPGAAHVAGLALFLAGVAWRLWAIRTLGRYYSHRVQTLDLHRAVTSGPYRFVRHPAYAGMIVANAGVVLFLPNVADVTIFLVVLLPAIVLRIRVEERLLFEVPGYREYAHSRMRLVPGVW